MKLKWSCWTTAPEYLIHLRVNPNPPCQHSLCKKPEYLEEIHNFRYRALTDSFHESVMCLYGSTSYGHITHETLYWTVSCLIESVCIFVSAEQILCHRASKCAAPISNELTNLRWCNCSPISDELRYTMLYKNNPRWRLTRNWRKLLFVVY